MGEIKQFPGKFHKPEENRETEKVVPAESGQVISFPKKPKPSKKLASKNSDFGADWAPKIAGLTMAGKEFKTVFPNLDANKYYDLKAVLPSLTGQENRGRTGRLAADYSKTVRSYTVEELTSWVNDHFEIEWRQKPVWYLAIVNEIARRLEI